MSFAAGKGFGNWKTLSTNSHGFSRINQELSPAPAGESRATENTETTEEILPQRTLRPLRKQTADFTDYRRLKLEKKNFVRLRVFRG